MSVLRNPSPVVDPERWAAREQQMRQWRDGVGSDLLGPAYDMGGKRYAVLVRPPARDPRDPLPSLPYRDV